MEKIYLRPIQEEEFARWKANSFENYVKEKEKSGLSPEDARLVAERSFNTLLPNGPDSPGQTIYSIVERSSETVVGTLWWGMQREGNSKAPWIYDIVLEESARGKGYGREAMQAVEKALKELGHKKLGLHVFGHNTVARGLYDSLGFRATSIVMNKELA
jgi:RimJ/RimL family protein N-acetyltransferase